MKREEIRGKKIGVLGDGIDTQDVVPYLENNGAELTILDEKKDGKGFGDLTGFDVLVRSPGVYRYRPEIVVAEKAGVVITSKTKIFFDACPAKIIGVTGTKGKGTTSTLIYQILKKAGKDVYLGGNIGAGVFGCLDMLTAESIVVLELSSFQLVDLHRSPHIAVVLMVTSEHLDWHKSPDEYVGAKLAITKYQLAADFVVANKDYENSRRIGEAGLGKKIWVSKSDWDKPMRLRGEHNRENVAAAAAVAEILNVEYRIVEEVVKEFKGLEHRLEEVVTVDGVTYFDDSFSTTPETAIAALQAFEEPKVMILGGSDKGSDFRELGVSVSRCNSIRGVVLIGLMADKIRTAIGEGVEYKTGARTMSQIVEQARSMARPGDVVVLSPAAASFDMFKNYKDRGDQFKSEVVSLSHSVL